MKNNSSPKALKTKTANNHIKNDLVVYLYNIIEDEWQFINSITNKSKREEEIRKSELTADCFYLSMATQPNFVYITPIEISENFQKYAQNLFKYKASTIIIPKQKTHRLCSDLIYDKKAWNRFLKIAKTHKRVVLTSYSASQQFYELKSKLEYHGIETYIPEAPEIQNAWTVNFYGSKSGFRQLAQQSIAEEPDFMIPNGVICVGKFDAAKIAANKFMKQKGVVIKTNKGSGGNGVLIFRENELPSEYKECEQKIQEYLDQELYWEKFPIIVEDLININYAVAGGHPNIEFKIAKNGKIEMLFYCMLKVTPSGSFYGLDMGTEVLNDRNTARLVDTGYYIAEKYSSAGYRGHFDVDCIAAKNNHIYVSESNTRNTGGTDVYKIVSKLIGKEFMYNSYVISRSHFQLSNSKFTIHKLTSALKPLTYDKKTKEGIIFNSSAILKSGELIYMIIAKNKKRAYQINEQLKSLIAS